MRKISVLLLLAIAGCAAPMPSRREFILNTYSPNNFQYPVTVNYKVTIDSLIKDGQHDGKYFLMNSNINSNNFSLTITGEKKVRMQLIHFNKQPMAHSEILAALDKKRLRPANIQEFLSLVQQYSLSLRKFSTALSLIEANQIEIVCFGAFYNPQNNFYSEVLHWYVSYDVAGLEGLPVPVLNLTPLELNWMSTSYFAVVSADSVEEDLDFQPKTIEFKDPPR